MSGRYKISSMWLQCFEKLKGKITEDLIDLKDGHGESAWEYVHEKSLGYFSRNCLDKPWTNHVALLMLTKALSRYDAVSVLKSIQEITPRLNDFFSMFELKSVEEFKADDHIYKYLTLQLFKEHSKAKRAKFASSYNSSNRVAHEWIRNKCDNLTAQKLKPYLLPIFSYHAREIHVWKQAHDQAAEIRKTETDAIAPLYPNLRAEAHLRWNQLKRLRKKYIQAINEVEKKQLELPFDFNYDDSDEMDNTIKYVESFYFRLWDQKSFVLAHKDKFIEEYISNNIKNFKHNAYFLEFIEAKRIETESVTSTKTEGLWFAELLKEGVLGIWSMIGNEEVKERKKSFLSRWGYGDDQKINSYPRPFMVNVTGIMTQGRFITQHQGKAPGIIFNPEVLFTAGIFGLAAIDIITTTGARINEVLQIRNTKDCFVVKSFIDNEKQIVRYLFRATPKGRTEPENFYLSDESVKVIRELRNILSDHYPDGKIPVIKYGGVRGLLIDKESSYLFQYNHTGLDRQDVTACMRFLLHGMVFQNQAGNPVNVKPHLLRHAFANHLHQAQKLPLDIIASILHQKDLEVTDYYAEATDSQVAIKTHELHQIMATYIDLNSSVLRGPEELITAFNEAQQKVGVYTQALGGTCSIDAVCPVKMACVGCGGKIPAPEKKHELMVYKNWAEESKKMWEEHGQPLEAKKMTAAIRSADKELYEIMLIEKYRKDEQYEPELRSKSTT